MSIELKPCPFCGSDSITNHDTLIGYSVGCDKCGAVAAHCATKAESISAWNTRTAIQQAEAQATQAEVTDSMIREAFLTNGFTIKDGHSDLKPYVYAAARALLALQASAQVQATQPAEVTDDQIESCALEAGFSVESTGSIWAVDGLVGTRVDPGLRKFARAIRALQSRSHVQGDPFGYIHHYIAHDEHGAIIDTTWEADGCADALPHPTFPDFWKWSHATPFYTTPQQAQAKKETP